MASSRQRHPERRSPQEWALRVGIAAAALAIGYVSTVQTLAFALLKSNTERAHALSPGDGRIAAALAEQLAASGVGGGQRARADRLATQALVDEPLAVPALTALGLDTQLRGDIAQARRLFVHSNTLSRRELGTQLWLIQDAVARGDVRGALRHYDIALRTARSAPDLLFPVLSRAIGDPAIAGPLATILATRPAWGEAFVYSLGGSKADPIVRAAFLRRLAHDGYPVPKPAQVGVLYALIASGAFDEGWAFYRSLRPNVRRDRSRDPDFAAQLQTPTAFDWTPTANDTGINASIQRTQHGGVFEFSAPSTVGGMVLQQAQFLPPGRYRLDGISGDIDQTRDVRPYWQLDCNDGRDAGRVEMPNSAENGGRFAGEFVVDGRCTVQTLRLIVRPSPDIGGVSGRIERVSLTPVANAR